MKTVSPDLTVLLEGAGDPRVLNRAVEELSTEYIVLVDEGSELSNQALAVIRDALTRFPETDLLYGDTSDLDGSFQLLRPSFSAVRLRSQDYLGGVKVFRTALLRAVGGFRDGVAGNDQSYDVALRFSAKNATVLHVPEVIGVSRAVAGLKIARRSDRERIDPGGEGHAAVVRHHVDSLGVHADVEITSNEALRLRYAVDGEPLVSLIIPTRGGSSTIAGTRRVLVVEAVRSILNRSTYRNLEFVIVADDATPQAVIDELVAMAGDRLRLVRWSDPFNFSAKINRGAACAGGDYLLPLNDDVELLTPDWIETMLGLAQQPGIGLVGATLFFEDGSIQHGGHLYRGGAAGHIGLSWGADWDDRLSSLSVDREVSGVTAACAMLTTDMFWAVGGFSTLLPGNYNDADLSLKIRRTGASVVVTPHVRLYHFESKSRVATVAPSELATIQSRWRSHMQFDEFWPEE